MHSLTLLIFFVNFDLIRVLSDVGVDRLLDKFALPTCNTEDEIVQGGTAKDVNMVTCTRS